MPDEQIRQIGLKALDQKMAAVDIRILKALSNFRTNIPSREKFSKELAFKRRRSGYHQLTQAMISFLKAFKEHTGGLITQPLTWITSMMRDVETSSTITYILMGLNSMPFDQATLGQAMILVIDNIDLPLNIISVADDILNGDFDIVRSHKIAAAQSLREKYTSLWNGATEEHRKKFDFVDTEQYLFKLEESLGLK